MNLINENQFFEKYMKIAIQEAYKAYDEDEVPIGAVVTINGEIIASEHNRNRALSDPSAHAEILALREASKKLGVFRLVDADLYVTVEPCPMCAGAMVYSRIKRLIYGCDDPKAGCVESVFNIVDNPKFNHRIEYHKNILRDECAEILKKFFKEKRCK